MNYKELLNRYREGLVTEEEKQSIEHEIEKHEALEEYLSEIMDKEFEDIARISRIEKHDEETIKLKKSVNNRLRKVIFTSVVLVIALVASVFFVISPLIDALYYNPDKITVGKPEADINFDVYAISELNLPGLSPSTVLVEKLGFGAYVVKYSYRDVFTNEYYNVNHRIQRGKITSTYRDSVINTDMFLDIKYPGLNDENYIAKKKENIINHIEQLNPISYISAAIMFEKDLTMEELYSLELKYRDIEFNWAGIRTESPDENIHELIGIQLKNSSGRSALAGNEHIEKKYPGFFLWDWLVNREGLKVGDSPIEAQAYEHHYMNLLQYAVDRQDAVNVLEHRRGKDKFYKSALKYAEEHGVKTYGVLVFGEAKDLLGMIEKEAIKGLEFNQALVSKRNID